MSADAKRVDAELERIGRWCDTKQLRSVRRDLESVTERLNSHRETIERRGGDLGGIAEDLREAVSDIESAHSVVDDVIETLEL